MFRRSIPRVNVSYRDIRHPQPNPFKHQVNDARDNLNMQKNRLDNVSLDLVKSVMKSLDKYYSLHKILKRKYNAQIVTNAWLKCYELLNEFNLLDIERTEDYRFIFLNAELPGSFVCAINHYIVSETTISYDWLANSLLSDGTLKKEPTGDRYGIFENNPENWVMGDLHNGDVTDINVIELIEDQVLTKNARGVDLYTSDIGIDVSDDYKHQEELNTLENLGQIILGFKLLRKGGNMFIKIYTYFTDYNLSLLVILRLVFDFMYIAKPLTSKPTNSEIYVVCKGFRGISHELISDLCNRLIYHKNKKTLPCIDGPFVNLQHNSIKHLVASLVSIEIYLYGELQFRTLGNALSKIEEEKAMKTWKRNRTRNIVVTNQAYEHNRWFFFNNMRPIPQQRHIKTK
jgi:cap2 methyltransferase